MRNTDSVWSYLLALFSHQSSASVLNTASEHGDHETTTKSAAGLPQAAPHEVAAVAYPSTWLVGSVRLRQVQHELHTITDPDLIPTYPRDPDLIPI